MAKDPETPPAQPNPWDILNKLADALASAKSSETAGNNSEIMARLTTALERVSEAQIDGAKLIAAETRRAYRRSNEVPPGISVFNRRGLLLRDEETGPRKPPLKCPMLIPFLIEWESCTREEVELLNLLEPGEYSLSLIDKSKIRMGISITYKLGGVQPSRLLMNNIGADGSPGTAFNNDNFRLIPTLTDMLRQLLRQHDKTIKAKAAAILSDEEEEALIEAGELTVSQ